MKEKQGFVLISAVMLLIFAGIAVLGLSFFIIGNSRQLTTREASLKSPYLSEAGIQEAIYWYRERGYFTLGQYTINPNETYSLSGDDAGLLVVDPRGVSLTEKAKKKERKVEDIYLQSATDSKNLTITDMIVTWNESPSYKLDKINIGGGGAEWSGTATSPANCNINDIAIVTSQKDLVFTFDGSGGNPSAEIVNVRFIMQDGTYKELDVYSDPPPNEANFTVSSQGSVDRDALSYSTTIEAEYNAAISQIVGYRKIQ